MTKAHPGGGGPSVTWPTRLLCGLFAAAGMILAFVVALELGQTQPQQFQPDRPLEKLGAGVR